MRLQELIDVLTEFQETCGEDDVHVRVAYQPSYPLAATLGAVSLERGSTDKGREGAVVWLAADATAGYDENPYAPSRAWDEGEWSEVEEDEEGV